MPPHGCPDLKTPVRDVEGKVAFITGGSSGIGLGIARAFAGAGMKVAIGYRTQDHLEKAMKYLESVADRVHAISVDVTDRPGMEKAAAETVQVFGKVHVLVNNAGVAHPASLGNMTYDTWDWMMGVNVNGVFNGVHAFLPRIRLHGEGGHIITTSSIAGLVVASGAAGYTASKFAVVGMMESLRTELANANIGTSVYCPAVVRSNITDSNRNRPSDLTDGALKQGLQAMALLQESMNNPEIAMDPLQAGELVLRGMCNNDLYILANVEYEQIIRDRSEALVASFPRGFRPTEAQAEKVRPWCEKSIYRSELERKAWNDA